MRYYYSPNSTNNVPEAQRGQLTCPRRNISLLSDVGFQKYTVFKGLQKIINTRWWTYRTLSFQTNQGGGMVLHHPFHHHLHNPSQPCRLDRWGGWLSTHIWAMEVEPALVLSTYFENKDLLALTSKTHTHHWCPHATCTQDRQVDRNWQKCTRMTVLTTAYKITLKNMYKPN